MPFHSHDDRAIGVFDSGVGGLTVAGVLHRLLPNERLVYLGDTARVPYGNRSPEVIQRYAEMCASFLRKQDIKALVVACYTVSAVALPHLARLLPIPVVGMITPGAKQAVAMSPSGRIGVIGTLRTVQSGVYRQAILEHDPHAHVVQQACPLFVPLAEEGFADHAATELIAEEYLRPLKAAHIDTLVLGCTHYPILQRMLKRAIGDSVQICDASQGVAQTVLQLLTTQGKTAAPNGSSAQVQFFLTDLQPQFKTLAERFFGRPTNDIERVDLV